jgi:hypothetical protein
VDEGAVRKRPWLAVRDVEADSHLLETGSSIFRRDGLTTPDRLGSVREFCSLAQTILTWRDARFGDVDAQIELVICPTSLRNDHHMRMAKNRIGTELEKIGPVKGAKAAD